MNVLKVMEGCAYQMEDPSDFAALIGARNVVEELIEALQAMLEFPNAGPSHDMARAALAKATP